MTQRDLVAQDLLPFTILEIPDGGAFATVVVADTKSGDRVALKVLKGELVQNANAVTRLRDEARVLGLLQHPNIVRVDEFMMIEGRPLIVMECVEGISLRRLLREYPNGIPGAIAAKIIHQVADALRAAFHLTTAPGGRELHLVHRDIKPANILFSVEGEIKLVDFGLVKGDFVNRESRTTSIIHGSRGYGAPELLDEDPEMSAVDIYALGICLFELLTGKVPVISRHHRRHDDAVMKNLSHLQRDDLTLHQLATLKHLIRRMCLYEADHRPHHEEVSAILQAILEDEAPDFVAFARTSIQPILESRRAPSPTQNANYFDVQFLEKEGKFSTLAEPNTTEAASDRKLRAFLRKPGWEKRIRDLQLVLTEGARWTPKPFLEILDRLDTPPWKFWVSRPNEEQIATALEFLRQRPTDAARRAASRFVRHSNERVRRAASALLQTEAD